MEWFRILAEKWEYWAGHIFLKESHKMIWCFSLSQEWEISYTIWMQFRKKWYASEVMYAVERAVFWILWWAQMIAEVMPENKASINLLVKHRFEKIGKLHTRDIYWDWKYNIDMQRFIRLNSLKKVDNLIKDI